MLGFLSVVLALCIVALIVSIRMNINQYEELKQVKGWLVGADMQTNALKAMKKDVDDKYFKLSGKHAELQKKLSNAANELQELASREG